MVRKNISQHSHGSRTTLLFKRTHLNHASTKICHHLEKLQHPWSIQQKKWNSMAGMCLSCIKSISRSWMLSYQNCLLYLYNSQRTENEINAGILSIGWSKMSLPFPCRVLCIGRYRISFFSHLFLFLKNPFLSFPIFVYLRLLPWSGSVIYANLHPETNGSLGYDDMK